jgi:hypothetical protein
MSPVLAINIVLTGNVVMELNVYECSAAVYTVDCEFELIINAHAHLAWVSLSDEMNIQLQYIDIVIVGMRKKKRCRNCFSFLPCAER